MIEHAVVPFSISHCSAFHNARPLDRETRMGRVQRVVKLSPLIAD